MKTFLRIRIRFQNTYRITRILIDKLAEKEHIHSKRIRIQNNSQILLFLIFILNLS